MTDPAVVDTSSTGPASTSAVVEDAVADPGATDGLAVDKVLAALTIVLEARKHNASPESSYVAQLHYKGLDKILKKVGEECTETIIAAKDAQRSGDNSDVIYETADLWFHTLVMLSHLGEDYRAVLQELERRFDLSGLAEKAARTD